MPKHSFMDASLSLEEHYQQQGLWFFMNWWACEIGDLTLLPGADHSPWKMPVGRFDPHRQQPMRTCELYSTIDTPDDSERVAEPDKWPVRIWKRTA